MTYDPGSGKNFNGKYILLETVSCLMLGFAYVLFIWNNIDIWEKTIGEGIITFFGGLSILFFFAVFLIGIIHAKKSKRTKKIKKAIFYSILFWLLSVLLTILFTNSLRIVSIFLILAGIVSGFNLGLLGDNPSKVE